MSKKICANSLNIGDMKNNRCLSPDNIMHYTAVFVVDNRQHIDLFLPIQKYMRDFKILYINLMCWGKQRVEIENYLISQNVPYVTVNSLFLKKQIDHLFRNINPNIVIVGHDTNPPNRKIIQSATNLNIPTLLIQDGIYGDSETLCEATKKTLIDKIVKIPSLLLDTHYNLLDKVEIVIDGIESMMLRRQFVGRGKYSNIAVFGNATKKLLEREGVDPEKIILTGSTKFDYLYFHDSAEDYLTLQQLGILPNKKIILLITQPFVESGIWSPEQREEYVSQVGTTVRKFNGCQLIIKFRQERENGCDYKDLLNSYGIDAIICGDIALYTLIDLSDIVVTVSSTAGLEAIAAKKPLIIFDPFNTPGSSLYNSEGILFLSNIDDLSLTVNKIMSDRLFRENILHKQNLFLEENIFKNDGKAAERIYNQIINMIKG